MKEASREESAAFFEAFNAKYMKPEEVAEGFVYSSHFEELCGSYHAVLVGPRGSGKTTLLKMLQPAALSVWKGGRAQAFKDRIKYSGVFIASDTSWSEQLSALGYGKLKKEHHTALVLACFTTHILHSVVSAMMARCDESVFRKVSISFEVEQEIAKKISEVMKVRPSLPTLLSVKQSLRDRLSGIRVTANRGAFMAEQEFQALLGATEFLHLDFLDAVSNITEVFNDLVGEPNATWALLFDELETAPEWIVERLFSAFRVSDPKILLKLAISPVSPVAYQTIMSGCGPSGAHDHRQIRLWYTDKVNAKQFCQRLWASLTRKYGIELSAYDALGESSFDARSHKGGGGIHTRRGSTGIPFSLVWRRRIGHLLSSSA